MAAIAGGALLAAVGPGEASACSCLPPPPPREALDAADAVFEGRVVSVDDAAIADEATAEGELPAAAPGLAVAFEVVRAWKGVERERAVVRTARDSAGCGVAFEPGRSYLVYASGAPLETGLCTRTQPIEGAGDDLSALGAGVVPFEVGGEDAPAEAPVAPARGGCASCAAAGRHPADALAWPGLAALVALRVARRRPPAGAAPRRQPL